MVRRENFLAHHGPEQAKDSTNRRMFDEAKDHESTKHNKKREVRDKGL